MEFPPSIGKMAELTYLNLYQNFITGIPDSVLECKVLADQKAPTKNINIARVLILR